MYLIGNSGIVLKYTIAVWRRQYDSCNIPRCQHLFHGIKVRNTIFLGYHIDHNTMVAGIRVDDINIKIIQSRAHKHPVTLACIGYSHHHSLSHSRSAIIHRGV